MADAPRTVPLAVPYTHLQTAINHMGDYHNRETALLSWS